jgi:hypothetical protein
MTDQDRNALEALEEALRATRASVRWQCALACVSPIASPASYRLLVSHAVDLDDAAREAANVVRVHLGGEAEQPAEPPAARPDET